MSDPTNLYWDTCVLYRYALRTPTEYLADSDQLWPTPSGSI